MKKFISLFGIFAVFGMALAYLPKTYAEKPSDVPRGPDPKVDVCHLDYETGLYHLINVSANSLPAHLSHGDGAPGDFYPEMENAIFADDCSIEYLCSVYEVNVDSVNGNSSYRHDYEIKACPGEEPVGEWLGGAAGPETVSAITLAGGELSFTAVYNSYNYTWYPWFVLESNNTLTFKDGHGVDNVFAAQGTWSVSYE